MTSNSSFMYDNLCSTYKDAGVGETVSTAGATKPSSDSAHGMTLALGSKCSNMLCLDWFRKFFVCKRDVYS